MTEPTTPSIGDLINSGIAYAKSSKAALPYVALATVASISPVLGQLLGGLVALACGVGLMLLMLMVSREVIAGGFAMRDSDWRSVAILFGCTILIVFALIIVAVPLAYMLASSATGAVIFNLVVFAAAVAIFSRLAFAPAAMSVGEPVSFASLLSQSAPYWTLLATLIVAAALPAVIFVLLFGGGDGFGGFLVDLIAGAISGVTGIIAIAAIARLYVQVVRG